MIFKRSIRVSDWSRIGLVGIGGGGLISSICFFLGDVLLAAGNPAFELLRFVSSWRPVAREDWLNDGHLNSAGTKPLCIIIRV
jgi:hypothetical protein